MAGVSHWAMILVAVVTLAVPSQDQDTSETDEIVVIGRKMRSVRIDYRTDGPILRRCDVDVSSGDVRIDRLVCAMVKACVWEGYDEVPETTACVRGRIESFEGFERTPHPPAAQRSPGAEKTAPKQMVQSAPKPDEIIVTGSLLPRAGLWRFEAMSTMTSGSRSSIIPPRSWNRCVRNDAIENTMRQIVGAEIAYSSGGVCKLKDLRFRNGSIAGVRRCLSTTGRTRTEIAGSYSSDSVSINENTEFMANGRTLDGSGMELLSITTGRRLKDCVD